MMVTKCSWERLANFHFGHADKRTVGWYKKSSPPSSPSAVVVQLPLFIGEIRCKTNPTKIFKGLYTKLVGQVTPRQGRTHLFLGSFAIYLHLK